MAGQNRSASRKQSGKIAFCGMMVALSVALMLTDRNVLCADD